jgi:predicted ATPase
MPEPLKIYIACTLPDMGQGRLLRDMLKKAGFSPWLSSIDGKDNILPGETKRASELRKQRKIDEAKKNCDAFLIIISKTSASTEEFLSHINSEFKFATELFKNKSNKSFLFTAVLVDFMRKADYPKVLFFETDIEPVDFRRGLQESFREQQIQKLIEALNNIKRTPEINRGGNSNRTKRNPSLIISRIELFNIRCFRELTIDFKSKSFNSHWAMILGDNSIGKSTLLKSIALGLCNESDATALIKTSEAHGEFIRRGAKEGYIKIHLSQNIPDQRSNYVITTKIAKKSDDAPEIVRQETEPAEDFPWGDIFVCGYGAYRSKQADTSYEQYRSIDAVRSLFDHQTSLQNPEVILLRQDSQVRAILEEKLKSILMLDNPNYDINYSKRGLEIDGPWGRMPFQTLSDGYRSTTIWVLDFIGWLIHAERLIGNPDIGGILIIDEIEQHLHPIWQRYIVQRLRQQFPTTQIIASTHTPLVAAGIADVDRSLLLKLERNDHNEISIHTIDQEQIAGKRADQVLTSDAFGLLTTRNERSHDDVDRYTKLLGNKHRTEAEEAELQTLRILVQNRLSNAETPTAQAVEKAVDEALQNMITNISPEMLSIETKKQLQTLFNSED